MVKIYQRSTRSVQQTRRIPIVVGLVAMIMAIGGGMVVRVQAQSAVSQTADLLQQDIPAEASLDRLTTDKATLASHADRLQNIPNLPLLPYGEAQAVLAQTEPRLVQLDAAIAARQNFDLALQKANEAAQMVQNPPHPVEVWQGALERWQAAIAALEAVDSTTTLHPTAQEKLSSYRNNFAQIEQQLAKEINAREVYIDSQNKVTNIRISLINAIDSHAGASYPGLNEVIVSAGDSELREVQGQIRRIIALYEAIPLGTYYHQDAQEILSILKQDVQLISDMLAGNCDQEACPIPQGSFLHL